MYKILRKALFCLPAETSHGLALNLLDTAERLHLSSLVRARPPAGLQAPVELMGLHFSNPVGLAAGLDKNAEHIDALAAMGFGFIEVGTLTPRPQPGNPRPRLFRLEEEQAIINRMGFNNKGIDYALERIRKSRYRGVLGINIGKNFDTPVEEAAQDYLIGMRKAWELAGYIVVNLSSPNTPGLRSLQFGEELEKLLRVLKQEQHSLTAQHGKKVPLLVKIAPDLSGEEIDLIAAALLKHEIDGVIATNTTLERSGVENNPLHKEAGGLSGMPLQERSTQVIRRLHQALRGQLPIIGVGGISCAEDARRKIEAGASLVQLYSGFIYQGPALIAETVAALAEPSAEVLGS